jgi:DNA-binding transcriptional LysR family regulator
MDLRRLKHLVALADERHFGRAASRVHLSQPAFSRSIQAAESELGLQLFDRDMQEITCTSAGHFVIERARKLLFDSRCLERDVGLYRERLMGDLAFGVGPFPAVSLVPRLMTELRTRYPGINSRVEVNNWKYLLEHLRTEELDFFVADIRNVPRAHDLSIQNIGRQQAGFYVRKDHPLLQRKRVAPADILPYGLASVRLPPEISRLLTRLFGLEEGTRLPIAVECDDLHLLKRVALTTDTVVAASIDAVVEEIANGSLLLLSVSGIPDQFSEMGVVSLKGRSHSPTAAFAVNFLREQVASSTGKALNPAKEAGTAVKKKSANGTRLQASTPVRKNSVNGP